VATSDVTALQRSDLNEFLFADVGTEPSGMMLSVVSLFARQGSDPWREADRLAELPKAVAADSLARSIAEMPQGRWNLPDAAVIAARLIGLLPKRPARVKSRSLGGATDWLPSLPSARNAVTGVPRTGSCLRRLRVSAPGSRAGRGWRCRHVHSARARAGARDRRATHQVDLRHT
jgi:hypothetical protein